MVTMAASLDGGATEEDDPSDVHEEADQDGHEDQDEDDDNDLIDEDGQGNRNSKSKKPACNMTDMIFVSLRITATLITD